MAMGRPSKFTQELADQICTRLAEGESLRAICRPEGNDDESMPHIGTILRWVGENPGFREQYTRAREVQAETLADEIITISDGSKFADDDATQIARARLRVDTRKWVASKLLPKKYGDKVEVEHSGSLNALPDDQLDAKVAALLAKANVKA